MTRCLVVVVLVLAAACKKDPAIGTLQATATVNGSAIVITAACTDFTTLYAEAQAIDAPCKDGKVTLEVPVAKLGTGKQTIHVRASDDNGRTMSVADLSVDLSVAGQAPYLRIAGCVADPKDEHPTKLAVKVGAQAASCQTFEGIDVKLTIEANPKAKLTLAGKTVDVPDSGTLDQVVDLTEQVLAMPLDQVASDSALHPAQTATFAYALESGGKKLEGKIEITESSGDVGGLGTRLLALAAVGKVDHAVFAAAKPGEKSAAGWIGHDGKLRVTDRAGTVRDVGVIAIERETGRTENGTCVYDAEGKQITAKRVLVDVELAAMILADGTMQKKAFPASPAPDDCPQFEVMDRKDPKAEARVSNETIRAWLVSLGR